MFWVVLGWLGLIRVGLGIFGLFWAILGLVSAIKSANVKLSFSNFLDMCIGAKGRMSSKLRYVAPKLPDK